MPLNVWQFDPAQMSPYYNLSLCEALSALGCDVRYVTSRSERALALNPSERVEIDYHYREIPPRAAHPSPLLWFARAVAYPFGHASLLRKIGAAKPDVFHMQWSRVPFFDHLLIERIKAQRIPVVCTVHEILSVFRSESLKEQLGRIFGCADALIFHSAANKDDFRKVYPLLPMSRMHVIPHLALNNALYPADATRQSARERLNFPADAPIFLFFGAIRQHKGVNVLIDAFARIVSKRPDARLIIVGNPKTPADLPSLDALKDFRSNLFMRPEYIPFDEAWVYYLAADVVVFPYRSVYQSSALLTAMGYGRPVIVTDVGGMPETIDGNGWIVPPENPARLAEVMLDAIGDRERLESMGQRSLDVLRERHDPAMIARQTITLYETLRSRRA